MTTTPDAIHIPRDGLDADAEATIRAACQQARWEAEVRATYRRHLRRWRKPLALQRTAEDLSVTPSKVRRVVYGH